MLKKRLLYLFLLLLTLGLILFLLLKNNKKLGPGEPLRAIPVDAAVIVKVNNFEGLINKIYKESGIWNELRNTPGFGRLNHQMQLIDSLKKNNPEAGMLLVNNPSYISFHYTGKDKIGVLHAYEIPDNLKERRIHSMISELVLNQGTLAERNYDGKKIYDVKLLDNSRIDNFSFAFVRNIFLLSFSSLLLEDAIRQLYSNETLLNQEEFNKAYITAGKNVEANVFINYKKLPRILSIGVKNDFKAETRGFTSFAGWGEMDVNILSNVLLFNGFTIVSDSVNYAASLFQHQNPQKITADEILPSSTASFLAIAVSDPVKYFSDYHQYLRGLGRYNQYARSLDVLENTYEIDFFKEFMEVWDNEISLAFDAAQSGDKKSTSYLLIKVKSQSLSEEKFSSIIKKMAEKESKSLSQFTTVFTLDDELSYKIYQMPILKLTGKIFGELFSTMDARYFTLAGNYIIFSDSPESLGKLLHNMVLNKTLVTNQAYMDFKASLTPKSNLYFYTNIGRANVVFSKFLSESFLKSWNENIEAFQKIQVFGFQMYSSNRMLYSNLFLKHFTDFKDQPHTVWESRLDTTIDIKPVFTLNHTTRQNEVFVQDQRNTIYLINQAGRVLWKVPLNEKITSEIFQVDFYKNGKLQLLFNTLNYIHLIDRNGNYVEKYPVKLRSPATNGLAVFDYDKNRDYRMFIAGSDRKIYAYTLEGSLVQGWSFSTTESQVWQPVNHFRIAGKDYLVFGDRLKTYILDRRGNARVNVTAYFPKSSFNNYLLKESGIIAENSIVTTDTTGMIHFLYFNGKHSTQEMGRFSTSHFFDLKDMDGDGKKEYVFLDRNKLSVFKEDKGLLYDFKFNRNIVYKPIYLHFTQQDRKLGIVSREENLIYLINNDGSVYKGFPLRGNSPFSIGYFGGNTSTFNLIVGSNDNFLYNYTVQ